MGAHLLVRKKGMTRTDVAGLLEEAHVDAGCFLKETRYDDFARKFGNGSLFISSVPINQVPDEWIDYAGDIVLNNCGMGGADDIRKILGSYLPAVDSDAYDVKRGRGKATRVLRFLPSSGEPDPGEWLSPGDLRARLATVNPKAAEDGGASWVYPTLRAIAEGGFDCRILV